MDFTIIMLSTGRNVVTDATDEQIREAINPPPIDPPALEETEDGETIYGTLLLAPEKRFLETNEIHHPTSPSKRSKVWLTLSTDAIIGWLALNETEAKAMGL